MCHETVVHGYFLLVHTDAIAMPGAAFGEGKGSIYLSGILCSGFEASILDCAVNATLVPMCSHDGDAGVQCSSTG